MIAIPENIKALLKKPRRPDPDQIIKSDFWCKTCDRVRNHYGPARYNDEGARWTVCIECETKGFVLYCEECHRERLHDIHSGYRVEPCEGWKSNKTCQICGLWRPETFNSYCRENEGIKLIPMRSGFPQKRLDPYFPSPLCRPSPRSQRLQPLKVSQELNIERGVQMPIHLYFPNFPEYHSGFFFPRPQR